MVKIEKEAYLGVDGGSSSLKIAIIDKNHKLLDSIYLKNEGITKTIKKGFGLISKDYEIKSAGCTGSAREFIKILIGADLVKTEILAHSVATLEEYPDVCTIFDIGAEDSKIITIRNGVINRFIMNYSCGGGCGALLDSIATRLDIKIEDYGDIALKSKTKFSLPSKCGVFATSALVTKLNQGVDKPDILMGICRSLIENYLTLGESVRLRPPYVFQGATAKNKALVKALEEQLNHKVIIPKNCAIKGAEGIAILAENEKPKKTNFIGFERLNNEFKTETFIASGCSNHCEIIQVFEGDNTIGFLGNKCEKCISK